MGEDEGQPMPGCYLLVILGEPLCDNHKEKILQRVAKGLLSWNTQVTQCDLKHLESVCDSLKSSKHLSPETELLLQHSTEKLAVEVLYNPQIFTLKQCLRNLLLSPTGHKHVIHAGYSFTGSGSWILQDGIFRFQDFADEFNDPSVVKVLSSYPFGSIQMHLHCSLAGDWITSNLETQSFSKLIKLQLNPADSPNGVPGASSLLEFIEGHLQTCSIEDNLEASSLVGNIRFERPTMYIFPSGQGDCSLFGVTGFTMLIDGGFNRFPCFWKFVRHIERLDSIMITRINESNLWGILSLLRGKQAKSLYLKIGYVFCNVVEDSKLHSSSTTATGSTGNTGIASIKSDPNDLSISIIEVGHEIVSNLRALDCSPHQCLRESALSPLTLYHKVGHGTLEMYILSPPRDSRLLKDFLSNWTTNKESFTYVRTRSAAKDSSGQDIAIPISDVMSICCLLIWKPSDPTEKITRILFPGSAPQGQILEGLEKFKDLDMLNSRVCTGLSLKPKSIAFDKSSTVKSEQSSMASTTTTTKHASTARFRSVSPNIRKARTTYVKQTSTEQNDKGDDSSLSTSSPVKRKIKPTSQVTSTTSQSQKASTMSTTSTTATADIKSTNRPARETVKRLIKTTVRKIEKTEKSEKSEKPEKEKNLEIKSESKVKPKRIIRQTQSSKITEKIDKGKEGEKKGTLLSRTRRTAKSSDSEKSSRAISSKNKDNNKKRSDSEMEEEILTVTLESDKDVVNDSISMKKAYETGESGEDDHRDSGKGSEDASPRKYPFPDHLRDELEPDSLESYDIDGHVEISKDSLEHSEDEVTGGDSRSTSKIEQDLSHDYETRSMESPNIPETVVSSAMMSSLSSNVSEATVISGIGAEKTEDSASDAEVSSLTSRIENQMTRSIEFSQVTEARKKSTEVMQESIDAVRKASLIDRSNVMASKTDSTEDQTYKTTGSDNIESDSAIEHSDDLSIKQRSGSIDMKREETNEQETLEESEKKQSKVDSVENLAADQSSDSNLEVQKNETVDKEESQSLPITDAALDNSENDVKPVDVSTSVSSNVTKTTEITTELEETEETQSKISSAETDIQSPNYMASIKTETTDASPILTGEITSETTTSTNQKSSDAAFDSSELKTKLEDANRRGSVKQSKLAEDGDNKQQGIGDEFSVGQMHTESTNEEEKTSSKTLGDMQYKPEDVVTSSPVSPRNDETSYSYESNIKAEISTSEQLQTNETRKQSTDTINYNSAKSSRTERVASLSEEINEAIAKSEASSQLTTTVTESDQDESAIANETKITKSEAVLDEMEATNDINNEQEVDQGEEVKQKTESHLSRKHIEEEKKGDDTLSPEKQLIEQSSESRGTEEFYSEQKTFDSDNNEPILDNLKTSGHPESLSDAGENLRRSSNIDQQLIGENISNILASEDISQKNDSIQEKYQISETSSNLGETIKETNEVESNVIQESDINITRKESVQLTKTEKTMEFEENENSKQIGEIEETSSKEISSPLKSDQDMSPIAKSTKETPSSSRKASEAEIALNQVSSVIKSSEDSIQADSQLKNMENQIAEQVLSSAISESFSSNVVEMVPAMDVDEETQISQISSDTNFTRQTRSESINTENSEKFEKVSETEDTESQKEIEKVTETDRETESANVTSQSIELKTGKDDEPLMEKETTKSEKESFSSSMAKNLDGERQLTEDDANKSSENDAKASKNEEKSLEQNFSAKTEVQTNLTSQTLASISTDLDKDLVVSESMQSDATVALNTGSDQITENTSENREISSKVEGQVSQSTELSSTDRVEEASSDLINSKLSESVETTKVEEICQQIDSDETTLNAEQTLSMDQAMTQSQDMSFDVSSEQITFKTSSNLDSESPATEMDKISERTADKIRTSELDDSFDQTRGSSSVLIASKLNKEESSLVSSSEIQSNASAIEREEKFSTEESTRRMSYQQSEEFENDGDKKVSVVSQESNQTHETDEIIGEGQDSRRASEVKIITKEALNLGSALNQDLSQSITETVSTRDDKTLESSADDSVLISSSNKRTSLTTETGETKLTASSPETESKTTESAMLSRKFSKDLTQSMLPDANKKEEKEESSNFETQSSSLKSVERTRKPSTEVTHSTLTSTLTSISTETSQSTVSGEITSEPEQLSDIHQVRKSSSDAMHSVLAGSTLSEASYSVDSGNVITRTEELSNMSQVRRPSKDSTLQTTSTISGDIQDYNKDIAETIASKTEAKKMSISESRHDYSDDTGNVITRTEESSNLSQVRRPSKDSTLQTTSTTSEDIRDYSGINQTRKSSSDLIHSISADSANTTLTATSHSVDSGDVISTIEETSNLSQIRRPSKDSTLQTTSTTSELIAQYTKDIDETLASSTEARKMSISETRQNYSDDSGRVITTSEEPSSVDHVRRPSKDSSLHMISTTSEDIREYNKNVDETIDSATEAKRMSFSEMRQEYENAIADLSSSKTESNISSRKGSQSESHVSEVGGRQISVSNNDCIPTSENQVRKQSKDLSQKITASISEDIRREEIEEPVSSKAQEGEIEKMSQKVELSFSPEKQTDETNEKFNSESKIVSNREIVDEKLTHESLRTQDTTTNKKFSQTSSPQDIKSSEQDHLDSENRSETGDLKKSIADKIEKDNQSTHESMALDDLVESSLDKAESIESVQAETITESTIQQRKISKTESQLVKEIDLQGQSETSQIILDQGDEIKTYTSPMESTTENEDKVQIAQKSETSSDTVLTKEKEIFQEKSSNQETSPHDKESSYQTPTEINVKSDNLSSSDFTSSVQPDSAAIDEKIVSSVSAQETFSSIKKTEATLQSKEQSQIKESRKHSIDGTSSSMKSTQMEESSSHPKEIIEVITKSVAKLSDQQISAEFSNETITKIESRKEKIESINDDPESSQLVFSQLSGEITSSEISPKMTSQITSSTSISHGGDGDGDKSTEDGSSTEFIDASKRASLSTETKVITIESSESQATDETKKKHGDNLHENDQIEQKIVAVASQKEKTDEKEKSTEIKRKSENHDSSPISEFVITETNRSSVSEISTQNEYVKHDEGEVTMDTQPDSFSKASEFKKDSEITMDKSSDNLVKSSIVSSEEHDTGLDEKVNLSQASYDARKSSGSEFAQKKEENLQFENSHLKQDKMETSSNAFVSSSLDNNAFKEEIAQTTYQTTTETPVFTELSPSEVNKEISTFIQQSGVLCLEQKTDKDVDVDRDSSAFAMSELGDNKSKNLTHSGLRKQSISSQSKIDSDLMASHESDYTFETCTNYRRQSEEKEILNDGQSASQENQDSYMIRRPSETVSDIIKSSSISSSYSPKTETADYGKIQGLTTITQEMSSSATEIEQIDPAEQVPIEKTSETIKTNLTSISSQLSESLESSKQLIRESEPSRIAQSIDFKTEKLPVEMFSDKSSISPAEIKEVVDETFTTLTKSETNEKESLTIKKDATGISQSHLKTSTTSKSEDNSESLKELGINKSEVTQSTSYSTGLEKSGSHHKTVKKTLSEEIEQQEISKLESYTKSKKEEFTDSNSESILEFLAEERRMSYQQSEEFENDGDKKVSVVSQESNQTHETAEIIGEGQDSRRASEVKIVTKEALNLGSALNQDLSQSITETVSTRDDKTMESSADDSVQISSSNKRTSLTTETGETQLTASSPETESKTTDSAMLSRKFSKDLTQSMLPDANKEEEEEESSNLETQSSLLKSVERTRKPSTEITHSTLTSISTETSQSTVSGEITSEPEQLSDINQVRKSSSDAMHSVLAGSTLTEVSYSVDSGKVITTTKESSSIDQARRSSKDSSHQMISTISGDIQDYNKDIAETIASKTEAKKMSISESRHDYSDDTGNVITRTEESSDLSQVRRPSKDSTLQTTSTTSEDIRDYSGINQTRKSSSDLIHSVSADSANTTLTATSHSVDSGDVISTIEETSNLSQIRRPSKDSTFQTTSTTSESIAHYTKDIDETLNSKTEARKMSISETRQNYSDDSGRVITTSEESSSVDHVRRPSKDSSLHMISTTSEDMRDYSGITQARKSSSDLTHSISADSALIGASYSVSFDNVITTSEESSSVDHVRRPSKDSSLHMISTTSEDIREYNKNVDETIDSATEAKRMSFSEMRQEYENAIADLSSSKTESNISSRKGSQSESHVSEVGGRQISVSNNDYTTSSEYQTEQNLKMRSSNEILDSAGRTLSEKSGASGTSFSSHITELSGEQRSSGEMRKLSIDSIHYKGRTERLASLSEESGGEKRRSSKTDHEIIASGISSSEQLQMHQSDATKTTKTESEVKSSDSIETESSQTIDTINDPLRSAFTKIDYMHTKSESSERKSSQPEIKTYETIGLSKIADTRTIVEGNVKTIQEVSKTTKELCIQTAQAEMDKLKVEKSKTIGSLNMPEAIDEESGEMRKDDASKTEYSQDLSSPKRATDDFLTKVETAPGSSQLSSLPAAEMPSVHLRRSAQMSGQVLYEEPEEDVDSPVSEKKQLGLARGLANSKEFPEVLHLSGGTTPSTPSEPHSPRDIKQYSTGVVGSTVMTTQSITSTSSSSVDLTSPADSKSSLCCFPRSHESDTKKEKGALTTESTSSEQQQLEEHHSAQLALSSEQIQEKEAILKEWGKPLGLPIPPEAEPSKRSTSKPRSANAGRASSSARYSKPSSSDKPVYLDLVYIPHHGDRHYCNAEYFKRIRARYYVLSGVNPSKEVLDALIEGKKTWDNKDAEVTLIPSHETEVLCLWMATNQQILENLKIDVAPSASRCSVILQDQESSCSAYRVEF